MAPEVAPTIDFGPFMLDEGVLVGDAPTEAQLATAAAIDKACRHTGFMCLKNIGVSEEELQSYFASAQELFALPGPQKEETLAPIDRCSNIGYAKFKCETLNSLRPADLKEAYNIRNECFVPNDFRGCPDTFQRCGLELLGKLVGNLTQRFCAACALALGLEPDFFSKSLQRRDSCTLRFLHYPPCDIPADSNTNFAIRAGEHTDFGMFTVLFIEGEGTPGLQARSCDGGEVDADAGEAAGWVDVPGPGGATAVINTGALLARWTNDVWKATAHRVIVPDAKSAAQHRYSIACFFDPDGDEVVDVHPKLVPDGCQAKYAPITTKDYLNFKLQSSLESLEKS